MPTLENVNKHRADRGYPLLTQAEYDEMMRPSVVEEPPAASQRTIDIRKGLIDPNEPEEPPKKKGK